jgi:hypothetical protein
MDCKFIAHRVNTLKHLAEIPSSYGVELDLRDKGDRLILQHDPFSDGEDFHDYVKQYHHDTMILNVKSERIEHRVLEEIQAAGTVRDYFFFFFSYPMIRALVASGERRIAVRFSEFEPVESALGLAGQVDWVWVDCFTRLPLDDDSYARLSPHFRICIVSPELQGHGLEQIPKFAEKLRDYKVDAICTKRPDLWKLRTDSTQP